MTVEKSDDKSYPYTIKAVGVIKFIAVLKI